MHGAMPTVRHHADPPPTSVSRTVRGQQHVGGKCGGGRELTRLHKCLGVICIFHTSSSSGGGGGEVAERPSAADPAPLASMLPPMAAAAAAVAASASMP